MARALRFIALFAFSLATCVYGPSGRADAADEAGNVSAVAQAKVVINRGVELRQDGSIISDVLDEYELMQVNAHQCDPEAIGIEAECVFLIYEIQ